MAFNKNYYERERFKPPKINLVVQEWNYDELIGHLARVIGRKLDAQLAEDIVTELKRLEPLGWSAIVDTVESLMLMGKRELGNNLWALLLSNVNTYLTKNKFKATENKKGSSWFVPEHERSYELLTYNERVIDEILTWCRYAKAGHPLRYNGEDIVFKDEGLSSFTYENHLSKEDQEVFKKEGLTTELYLKYRHIGTWCILMDIYLQVLHKAILKECDEHKPDNNAIKNDSLRFLNHLLAERKKQQSVHLYK